MDIGANHKDLFITRLWSFNLSTLGKYHAEWTDYILKLRDNDPDYTRRSVRSGWKTPYRPFDTMPPFKPLEQAARVCFNHVLKDMELKIPKGFKGYQLKAGINLTDPGGYNVQHGHDQVYLAGCYYLKVPEKSGEITFIDPRPGAKYSLATCGGPQGSNNAGVQPRVGQLLIFPGWLEHRVEENLSDDTRISIVINACRPADE